MAVAVFHVEAGEVGEVAVARGVDEHAAAHGDAARFRLDHQRIDRAAVGRPHDAAGERVEERAGAGVGEHRVGRALEGGGVVGLGVDAAEDQVRRVQPAERAHAVEQVVGDAVHDLPDLAVHVGVQAAEVGDAGGGAHAAEEAVALDEQRRGAVPRSGGRRGDAGRPAAEDDDVALGMDRRAARGFVN